MTTKTDNTFAKERDNTFGLSYAREIYIKIDGKQTRINKYGGELLDLIDELGWDYQCMTCGGRETYDKLMQMLGIIEPDEVYMEI